MCVVCCVGVTLNCSRLATQSKRKTVMKTLENRSNFGATLAEASIHLAHRHPFHTGTLSASWEFEQLQQQSIYKVRSYGIVIAEYPESWNVGGWVYSDAYTLSKTTSKHANIVKKAWGL